MFNHTRILLLLALFAFAGITAGCGQGITVPKSEKVAYEGAEIFAQSCGGCHTMSAAGAHGSKPTGDVDSKDRTNGPNFDQRHEDRASVLTAIRQGGFSGAIMPGNIVTGEDAEAVAEFLDKYSGEKAE